MVCGLDHSGSQPFNYGARETISAQPVELRLKAEWLAPEGKQYCFESHLIEAALFSLKKTSSGKVVAARGVQD